MDDEEKQSGNDSENLKIECKSKRSINVLLQKLKDEFVAYHVQQNKSKEVDSESVNRKIYQVEFCILHPLSTLYASFSRRRCFA